MAETLKDKVAVITAAGDGFGKATAELFAEKDQCNLVLTSLHEEKIEKTARNCIKSGSEVIYFADDITKQSTSDKLLSMALEKFGKIDFLINYAGGAFKIAPIEEMDNETNKKIIDLNLNSVIMSCRAFTPQFKKQGYGKIINVSSVCDRKSWPGWSIYSAAKAAVNSFTRCLYTELRPHGICVTLIVPAGSNTGFQKAVENIDKFEWNEEIALRPEHIADMVYQACALSKGGCVSEMAVYGLAQDICGY
ncbi:MAG: SDR family NAD(P)-dependent oxidoreductase [Actinomycetota bacterium]|nr:SDR family NAD(P)-dependent oxidoreductase [Actinomycetota bacterium]